MSALAPIATAKANLLQMVMSALPLKADSGHSPNWSAQSGWVAAPGWLTWRSRDQRYFRQC